MTSLTARIAAALNANASPDRQWTEKDVQSFSLQTIRELLPEGSQIRAEVTQLIRSGEYIKSAIRPQRGRRC